MCWGNVEEGPRIDRSPCTLCASHVKQKGKQKKNPSLRPPERRQASIGKVLWIWLSWCLRVDTMIWDVSCSWTHLKGGQNSPESPRSLYIFFLHVHPLCFFPFSPTPLPPPPPVLDRRGPRDTLRLRLLTVASFKIPRADSFFIYSSFCLHRINEEAD